MRTQVQRGRKVQRKSNQKTLRIFYAAVGALALLGIAFLVTFLLRNDSGVSTLEGIEVSPPNAPVGTTPEGLYYKGDPDAPVKVVEYSDFQCPACRNFHETLGGQLETAYIETGRVQFIYHDFPLRNAHANAAIAAEAARAAGEQGKFWEMHDVIFARQSEWSTSGNPRRLFATYAEYIGLDRAQFEEALNSGKFTDEVTAAEQAALQAGIPATPTFVVNGTQVNASQLVAAIDAALAQAEQQE